MVDGPIHKTGDALGSIPRWCIVAFHWYGADSVKVGMGFNPQRHPLRICLYDIGRKNRLSNKTD